MMIKILIFSFLVLSSTVIISISLFTSEDKALSENSNRYNNKIFFNSSSTKNLTTTPISEATDLKQYQNSTLGLRIMYPSGWVQRPTENSTVVFSPRIGVELHVKKWASFGAYELNNLKSYDAYKLINSSRYIVDGKEVRSVLFQFNGSRSEHLYGVANLSTVYVLFDLVLSNDKIYSYAYVANNSVVFSRYLPVVKNMIELSIKDIRHAKNPPTNQIGLQVGNFPQGINFNPNKNLLYVPLYGSNIVSVIDVKTNKVLTNITVGSKPQDIAVIPFDNSIYVTNEGSNDVYFIDGITNTVTSEIKVGQSPINIASDPTIKNGFGLLFVSNRDNNSVSVLAGDTGKKIPVTFMGKKHDDIQVGINPWGVAVNPITNRLYVANIHSNDVYVVDYRWENLSSPIVIDNMTKVQVGDNPIDVAVDYNANIVYVVNLHSDTISVIDGVTNKVINTIRGVLGPSGIGIDQNNKKLFVTSEYYGTVYVIDTRIQKIEKTFHIGGAPRYIFFNEKNNIAYVSNYGSNSINLIADRNNNSTLLIGVRFKVSLANGATIKCDEKDYSNNTNYSNDGYGLFANNTILKCHAIPKNGIKFISWSGLDNSNEYNATLNILHFGTLTANVAPLPAEDVIQKNRDLIVALIASAILGPIIGWVLPWTAGIKEKKRQLRYLRTVIPLVDDIYKQHSQNKQNCLNLLEQQKKETIALLQGGIINDATYRILNNLIAGYILEVSK
jgi:YVTN family beta-propeller protein